MSVGEEAFHRLSARYIRRSNLEGTTRAALSFFYWSTTPRGYRSTQVRPSSEPHYSSLKPLAVAFCFIMIAGEIGVAEMNRAYC